jgi:hypothetical protein
MSFSGKNTWLRCYQQGGHQGFGYIGPVQPGSTWDGCVFIDSGGNPNFSQIIARNCKFINSSGLGASYNLYENIVFYNDNSNRTYLGGIHNLFRNIELHLNSTHSNILLGGARQCRVYNVTIYSYANAPFLSISNDVWADNIIEGWSVRSRFLDLLSGLCSIQMPLNSLGFMVGLKTVGMLRNLITKLSIST